LNGKTVLVTGGARGLGRAMAEAFVANSSNVVIAGRTEDVLKETAREIGACPIVCDVTTAAERRALLDEVRKRFGRVDVLVNNAGIHRKHPALEVSDEEFAEVVATNQSAVFSLSRECARDMIAEGGGAIIMVSSMASHYGIPQVVAYTAAKSAVEGMTRALSVEWAGHGVRVNCIAPGFIYSRMSAKALDSDPERKARVLGRTPMGRLGQPEDVAAAAAFLASDAAGYITGVVLPVDGGNLIGF
jgi:gluconate 5-dehydrogenase